MDNRDLTKPIFASIITMIACFLFFEPATGLNYIGMILTGVTIGWCVLSVYEGPTIVSDRIINEKMWRLTSESGIISLEDNDGDGKITLNDTIAMNKEDES